MFGIFKGLFGTGKPKKPQAKPAARTAVAKPAAKPGPSADRAQLLKQAQDVHRAKRKILDHLSDEDRAKLVGMAILTFLNQGRAPDDSSKK